MRELLENITLTRLMKRIDLRKAFVLLAIVGVVFFFHRLLRDIDRPYGRPWEHGYQDIIGRNHLKYGLKETKGLIVMGEKNGKFMRRFNHPPLLHLSVAGFLKVFGNEEWAARLLPISSSILALVFIYLIAEIIFDVEVALLSVFFASIMPMFNYFGQLVNFEPSTLLFSLMYFYSFLKLNKGKNYKVMFYFSGIVSFLLDWPAYFLIGMLALYSFFKDKKKFKSALVMVFLSIVFVTVYVLINRHYTGQIELVGRAKDRGSISFLLDPAWYKNQARIQWDYYDL